MEIIAVIIAICDVVSMSSVRAQITKNEIIVAIIRQLIVLKSVRLCVSRNVIITSLYGISHILKT